MEQQHINYHALWCDYLGILTRRVIPTVIIFLLLVPSVSAKDRCVNYIQEVRRQHFYYFGLQFPYWYGIGQLKQESQCRTDLTAFDGGQGISMMMKATEKGIEKQLGVDLDMYKPADAIKAQTYLLHQIHVGNKIGNLWITYQAYNGGYILLKKEYRKAGKADWAAMRKACKRKIITLKSGQRLDMCTVNYDYSQQIYKYGQAYRIGTDKQPFW